MKAYTSILDYPRSELNPNLWDNETMKLKPKVRRFLIDKAKEALSTVGLTPKYIILKGSIATYQWNEESDIDLSIYVDWDKYDESVYEEAKELLWTFKSEFLTHPIQMFVKDPEHSEVPIEVSDAIYDLLEDEWVLKPFKHDNFNPEKDLESQLKDAEEIREEVVAQVSKINSLAKKIKLAQNSLDKAANRESLESNIKDFRLRMEEIVLRLAEMTEEMREDRAELHEELKEKRINGEELNYLDRYQPAEINWKYLEHQGVLQFMKFLEQIVESDQVEKYLDRVIRTTKG